MRDILASSDTAPVRSGEELNLTGLAAYLSGRLNGAGSTIEVEQFPNGHSNLVYLVRINKQEFVLRRPPLGPVAPRAHDMAREYRVLEAVHPHFPEAPEVVLLCEDPSVIGSTFFLMERRRGVVIRGHEPPELAAIPRYPRLVSEAFIDCLVRLHSIDIGKNGLRALGKPEGFVERQVRGWADRWMRAKTEELPEMDRVVEWLHSRLPRSAEATLVHNDYKLDNVMMRPSADQVGAVLDWEMTTTGDPLADVGLTLCYWTWANVAAIENGHTPTRTITMQPGWYSRDEFLERYAKRAGRDVSSVGYYEVLGVFKLAVILQQIYYRFRRGQTSDERFRNFDEQVRGLVKLAATLAEKYGSRGD
ncbi:MAG TPA: phosphotransferase family protein [Bryobacteraceae bacterium]|nr:phosphotransferase family protein [Bryobacteraceae bacterium]